MYSYKNIRERILKHDQYFGDSKDISEIYIYIYIFIEENALLSKCSVIVLSVIIFGSFTNIDGSYFIVVIAIIKLLLEYWCP